MNPRAAFAAAHAQQRRRGLETARKCWDLHLRGMGQPLIAAELEINQSTVSRAIARGEKLCEADTSDLVAKHRTLTKARLEWLLHKALADYDKSAGERRRNKTRTIRGGSNGDTGTLHAEITSETKVGDVRFLSLAREIIADLRKLQGLDAPMRFQAVALDRPFEGLTDDQLRKEFVDTLKAAGIDHALPVRSSLEAPSNS